MMSFVLEPTDESVIVRIGKALDFRNAAEFKTVCQEKVLKGVRNFILEFSETSILDSTGLGAIFSLHKQARLRKGEVIFASVSPPVQIVIQMTGIHRVFQRYSSVEAAREAPSVRRNA